VVLWNHQNFWREQIQNDVLLILATSQDDVALPPNKGSSARSECRQRGEDGITDHLQGMACPSILAATGGKF